MTFAVLEPFFAAVGVFNGGKAAFAVCAPFEPPFGGTVGPHDRWFANSVTPPMFPELNSAIEMLDGWEANSVKEAFGIEPRNSLKRLVSIGDGADVATRVVSGSGLACRIYRRNFGKLAHR
jgi:hypothetical protein